MKKWRLLDTDLAHPYYVTALDDAISIARSRDIVPNTLHFYRRSPPGVSIGRMQSVRDVDLEECRRRGIIIVRRRSGGGTIYTDEGCLIYSLVFRSVARNPNTIFSTICRSIVSAIENTGIDADFKQPNDVLVNGRKVSGSAMVMRGEIILMHGTIIVDSDLDVMRRILLKKGKTEVTSLRREGSSVSIEEMKRLLSEEFSKSLGVEFEKDEPTDFERGLTEKLIDERYGRDEWNFWK